MRRARRFALGAGALALAAVAVIGWAHPPAADSAAPILAASEDPALVAEGERLFEVGCTSCHGPMGEGVQGQGPSLVGAGEAAVDFYVRTGRMPLGQVGSEPERGQPNYNDAETRALDAYVGSLGPGPAIPDVHPSRGSVSEGLKLFGDYCAGCHAISAKGGVVIGGYAPPLSEATATQVGEAIRVGPYIMPRFGEDQIDPGEVDSIARYVGLTQKPNDAGGLGIGHIGPVPEGLVAWLAAVVAMLLVARLIGERTDSSADVGDEGRKR